MPRPRRGLGQGLDALVRDSTRDFSRFERPATEPADDAPAGHLDRPQWEYACLERRRKRNGKPKLVRLWLSESGSAALLKPRPVVLATRSPWVVIGLLGEEGWELLAVRRRRWYFKRRRIDSSATPP